MHRDKVVARGCCGFGFCFCYCCSPSDADGSVGRGGWREESIEMHINFVGGRVCFNERCWPINEDVTMPDLGDERGEFYPHPSV